MAKYFRFPFARSGDKTALPDAVSPNGFVSYDQGYGPDYQLAKTDPSAKDVERDKQNQIFNDITGAIKVLQEQGVPDWIAAADNGATAFPYSKGAVVRYTDGKCYVSRTAANTALPTVAAAWNLVGPDAATLAAAGSRIGSDGFIEKWGELLLPASGVTTSGVAVAFAQPFPVACVGVWFTPLGLLDAGTGYLPVMATIPDPTPTGFSAQGHSNGSGPFTQTVRVRWNAKGY